MEKVIKPILYVIAAIIVFQFLSGIVVKKFDYFKNNKPDVSNITIAERERQLECLARNIYHEAGNEPFEGKVAVAQVTINRSESGMFPSDLCKVIYQKNKFMDPFGNMESGIGSPRAPAPPSVKRCLFASALLS